MVPDKSTRRRGAEAAGLHSQTARIIHVPDHQAGGPIGAKAPAHTAAGVQARFTERLRRPEARNQVILDDVKVFRIVWKSFRRRPYLLFEWHYNLLYYL